MNLIQKINDWSLIPVAHAVTWDDFTGLTRGGLFNRQPATDAKATLTTLIANLINWFIIIAFIIAFVYLVLQGIKYITSGGDATKATEARNGIINAIIGIIVIVLAFFIIRFAISIGQNPTGQTNPF